MAFQRHIVAYVPGTLSLLFFPLCYLWFVLIKFSGINEELIMSTLEIIAIVQAVLLLLVWDRLRFISKLIKK